MFLSGLVNTEDFLNTNHFMRFTVCLPLLRRLCKGTVLVLLFTVPTTPMSRTGLSTYRLLDKNLLVDRVITWFGQLLFDPLSFAPHHPVQLLVKQDTTVLGKTEDAPFMIKSVYLLNTFVLTTDTD